MDNPHPPGSRAYYAEIARQARRVDRKIQRPPKPRVRERSGKMAAHKRRLAADDALGCEVCGWRLPDWLDSIHGVSANHAHHVLPVKDGGSDDPSNLVILCPNHHAMAHRLLWGRATRPTKTEILEEMRSIDRDPHALLIGRLRRIVDT